MKNILITTTSFASETPALLNDLRQRGLCPVSNPFGRALQESELAELLDQYRPVGMLAGTEPITRSILERSGEYLKVISRVGAGWDNVDRKAAASLDIRVYRTEGVLTQSVAELTVGMILAALRGIAGHDRSMKEGRWKKNMGALLTGKTVGLVGFGEIGRRVGSLVNAFGARVIYYDPQPAIGITWAEASSMEMLLSRSDIISLHASGKGRIIGDEELKKCRQGVILINTARGGLVDEDALSRCLSHGQVSFACLDVFEKEPYSGPLLKNENVLLTPHIGSYAREARIQMEEIAVNNLITGLKEVLC
jgi:D-3-phosphoglycerate dehydrogenase